MFIQHLFEHELLQAKQKEWIDVSLKVADPDFAFLTIMIQGAGSVDLWLRYIENEMTKGQPELRMINAENISHQVILAEQSSEQQRAHHIARMWIKEIFEIASIINKDGATKDRGWKKYLNRFVASINLIREPLAKLQTAHGPSILQFPSLTWYPTVPSLGLLVCDKESKVHLMMRTEIADNPINIESQDRQRRKY